METQADKLLHMLRKTVAHAETYTCSFVYGIHGVFIENIPSYNLRLFSLEQAT